MANPAVTVGQDPGKHKLRRVLIRVGLVLLVATAAAGAGAGVRWLQQKQTAGPGGPAAPVIAKEVTEAQNLALTGDYDKAHETINNALEDSSLSAKEKQDLYLQQGVTYENEQKFDDAIESYRKAESLNPTMDVCQSIARMAEAKGDKELAITYYKKAATLVPEDEAMKDSLKKYFENKVIVLEGGQPNYE